jgi:phenylalanyl-tRNA synthetase beta chain
MQIPLSWINELVKIENIQLDDLIEKLTLGGFEVEEILELEFNNQKQIVLDISTTANRSDSLSIQGFSKEIAILLNKPLTISHYSMKTSPWKQLIETKIESITPISNCSMFLTVIVENFSDIRIPKWIKQKLINSGIMPNNNILDFQNYILLETGYPFCFYDFEKICTELKTSNVSLSISSNRNNESFVANNQLRYELNSSILTVNANEIPIGIAGISEAAEFAYSETTTKLLIEASIFNAAQIRQQSRKLGIRTDRSARYEKSLKNTYLIESLYRLISLLRIFNKNLICKLHTIYQEVEQIPEPILLTYDGIKKILGPTNQSTNCNINFISPDLVTDYLTRLNFQFIQDTDQLTWNVEVPHERTDDLIREIDLIEEIGRLHGFNNFLTILPKIKTIGNTDLNYKTRQKLSSCLLNLGFNELIHYSLVNEITFIKNEIQLLNPLLVDCSHLRISLLPSLIKTLQENVKQKNDYIEGFEYGHIFTKDKLKKFKEKEYVAGIFGGQKTKSSWSSIARALNWFEAKGKIELLFSQLNISPSWKSLSLQDLKSIFHPYKSAEIELSEHIKLGIFGQINPILANQLNISPDIYLFEFDLEIIKKELQKNKLTLYKEYSVYPKIIKDLSFIIQRDITFQKIQEVLYANGTEFLSEIKLLDEYRGKPIPDQKTSLCIQLTFQSNQRTLENKEIETIINILKLILINKFHATIRS